MAARIFLGGRFEVEIDRQDPGPAPSRAAACLLIGLAVPPREWRSRAELARKLYPDAEGERARAALRKTLSRMRRWLGDDWIEERGTLIRLDADWGIDTSLPDGQLSDGSSLAPGLFHPWMEEIRQRLSPKRADPDAQPLADLFLSIARQDPVVGRGMLTGAGSGIWNMDAMSIESLLRLTKPAGLTDHFAAEYLQFKGLYEHASAKLGSSLRSLSRAYRLAVEKEQMWDSRRAAALILFGLIESGDYGRAQKWMQRAARNSDDPICTMALAAEAWNRNQFAEARSIMIGLEEEIEHSERSQRTHYWYNRSVLAAESGRLDEYEDAYDRCRALLKPDDHFWQIALALSECWAMLQRNELERAALGLEAMANATRHHGWRLNQIYALEVHSLALALMGDKSRSIARWKEAEAIRNSGQIGLNERRRAIRNRILSLM